MKNSNINTTQKIVTAAIFASFVCVATMIIKIPSPLKGYLNLGDGVILLAAWIFPASYGFTVAGIGSALADLFSGYLVYSPATFVIKGSMSLLAYFTFKLLQKKIPDFTARIISGILAEIVMVAGYFVFEGIMYGFKPSVVNIPGNILQGVAGIILGVFLVKIFQKNKIYFR